MTRHRIHIVTGLVLIVLSLLLFAAPGSYAQSSDTSQLVTLTCTGSPCPFGASPGGQAVVWPASLAPSTNWLGYTASAGMFLPASAASGVTISLTSGAATVFAGLPDAASHRVLASLSPGQPYTISGLAAGEIVSVRSGSGFAYSLTMPAPATPTPVPCTDPTTCDPISSIHSFWRCNTPECQGADWVGSVISWPSWSADWINDASPG